MTIATIQLNLRKLAFNHLIVSLMTIGLSLGAVSSAHAATVRVMWDAVTTNEDGSPISNLGGYEVFYGTASGTYSTTANVGKVTTTDISGLTVGTTYFFSVKAYNNSGARSKFATEKAILITDGSGGGGGGGGNDNPPAPAPIPGRSVIGDYDSDGESDLLVVNLGNGERNYTLTQSSDAQVKTVAFGKPSDLEAPGDYNGDGIFDLGVVRKSGKNLLWVSHDVASDTDIESKVFGKVGDRILTGCFFDKDGTTDKAYVRGKNIRILRSETGSQKAFALPVKRRIGSLSCADIDNDGIDEIIVKGDHKKGEFVFAVSAAGKTVRAKKTTVRGIGIAQDVSGDSDLELGVLVSSKRSASKATFYSGDKTIPNTSVTMPSFGRYGFGTFMGDDSALFSGMIVESPERHVLTVDPETGTSTDVATLGTSERIVSAINSAITRAASATNKKKK